MSARCRYTALGALLTELAVPAGMRLTLCECLPYSLTPVFAIVRWAGNFLWGHIHFLHCRCNPYRSYVESTGKQSLAGLMQGTAGVTLSPSSDLKRCSFPQN
ncbi:hypothetical protein FKM82_018855 [Ascaphus truei]